MHAAITSHPLVIVPGINDSGPGHWQSLWQQAHPDARRITPASFDDPDVDDWVGALQAAVESCSEPPLLVAHSLGTLTVLEWAQRFEPVHATAAVLVALPDPQGPNFPSQASTFAAVRPGRFAIPAAVIASVDDPYDPHEYGVRVAAQIGARLDLIGAAGHINADSGLGEWAHGQDVVADLLT